MKKKVVPLSTTDGTMICQVDQIVFEKNTAKIEIPEKFLNSSGYIKVFFVKVSDASEIRLLPAALNNLKLN
jgi:hypothetical protein